MLCANGAMDVGMVGDKSDLRLSGESSSLPLLLSLLSDPALLPPPERKELGLRSESRLSEAYLTECELARESGAPLSIPVVVEIDEVKSGEDEVGFPAAAIRLATRAAA